MASNAIMSLIGQKWHPWSTDRCRSVSAGSRPISAFDGDDVAGSRGFPEPAPTITSSAGRREITGTPVPNSSRAERGCDADLGIYTLDDAVEAMPQHLVGALSCGNVGQVLTGTMTVTAVEFVIRVQTATSAGVPSVRTLRWRRIGGRLRRGALPRPDG
jgi:hypothetical protein